MMAVFGPWLVGLAAGCLVGGAPAVVPADPAAGGAVVLDDFEDPSGWSAHPADGVDLAIGSDWGTRGRALRLDFRFHGGAGYAVARQAFDLDLPANYAFSFRLRGAAPPNHLEFKLVDASGENVWWCVRRDVRFPRAWETFTIKKRHVQFAWGPAGGGEIRHVAAIEFVITAGSGGAGTVWIDEFELRPLPEPDAAPPNPLVTSSSETPGHPAAAALDADSTTTWEPLRSDLRASLTVDFRESHEFGAVVVDWAAERHAPDYDLEVSDDGTDWRMFRAVRGGDGSRDPLYLPESETRFLRLRLRRGAGARAPALRELHVQPLDWAGSRAAFFERLARSAPRGTYPRGIAGEQSYWTVVGVDGDGRDALLGEDGALEPGRGLWSVEPFLHYDGVLATWSDVRSTQLLEDGCLPIPSVRWDAGDLHLTVTAFAVGSPGASSLVARYRVANWTGRRVPGTLFLAIRPFQVNPPPQFLNLPGGPATIRSLAALGRRVRVNDEHEVVALTRPERFGAVHFDGGDIVAGHLRAGRVPPRRAARDPFEAASGALAFEFDLDPGGEHEVDVLLPLEARSPIPSITSDAAARTWVEREFERCLSDWRTRLGRATIQIPDTLVAQSLEVQLAYVLVNRAGPAIQPGTRSYARSWIRDGALTSSALLRMGHADAAGAFLEWFASHQYPSGKIPCVVDARGADPTPEHDSSGEFVFLVAEVWRTTGERALLERLWPRVRSAVGYLDSLRQMRRTAAYRTAENVHLFGLLPPSISHEGYSAKPMHSYWDDLWALRGFCDAALLAEALDLDAERDRIATLRDEFARDLGASVEAAMRRHGIDFVPGCADLGDFDATSTTIALAPVQADGVLPASALRRTFERYWTFFEERRAGKPWEAFTPYEIRNIGAFVRLGWRERANVLLRWFLDQQRPPGWRQWPEVVWRDQRAPHFLGDLPHTWVGSDFVRSVLDMLAYEREADVSLVLGAGVPAAWLEGPGFAVRGLRTRWGALTYAARSSDERVEVRIEAGLRVPPGGVVLDLPLPAPIRTATVDGIPVTAAPDGRVVVRELPAVVILRP